MSDGYDVLAKYYDALYAEKNYRKEVFFIRDLLNKFNVQAESILDIGCGTGNHIVEMYDILGGDILGIEPNKLMCQVAQNKFEDVDTVEVNNWYTYDVRKLDEVFDLITALFHVVNQIDNLEDLEDLFCDVSMMLEPGKLFVFDAWNEAATLINPPVFMEKKTLDFNMCCMPEMDFMNSSVVLNSKLDFHTGKSIEYKLPITLWPVKVFKDLCMNYNLEILQINPGFKEGNATTEDHRILFVTRKLSAFRGSL